MKQLRTQSQICLLGIRKHYSQHLWYSKYIDQCGWHSRSHKSLWKHGKLPFSFELTLIRDYFCTCSISAFALPISHGYSTLLGMAPPACRSRARPGRWLCWVSDFLLVCLPVRDSLPCHQPVRLSLPQRNRTSHLTSWSSCSTAFPSNTRTLLSVF